MAGTIQGITIEIDGNTTKLGKALREVNRETGKVTRELKNVEKGLKFNPTSVDLWRQKQNLLTQKVKQSEKEVAALKAAQEKLDADGVDQCSQEYVELRSKIVQAESKLKSFQKQLSAIGDVDLKALSEGFKEAGSNITSAGKAVAPVSAAVAAVGAAGLTVAADFETAMSKVKAVTGASGDEFDKLKEKAEELGASTAFSAQEVADGMTEMAKAGWSTEQILEGMGGVLDAAAASGEELSTVSTIVADAITGFGLAASDSAKVADLLTQAANGGTVDISDLGESFKYVAPVCASMGFSIEDATTAIAAMSTAGIKGSQAGTSLKTAFLNMASPTDKVAAAMEKIGLSVTDSEGNFKDMDTILSEMRSGMDGMTESEKENVIATIAGKNAVSGLMSVVNMTQSEYDALADSMDNASGVAEQTATVMQDNLQSRIEQLQGSLETIAIKLTDYVLPYIEGFVEKLTDLADKFGNMDPEMQKMVVGAVAVAAALAPVLMIVGSVASGIGALISVIGLVAGAFTTVVAPVLAVIAVFAAVIAAVLLVKNHFEEIEEVASQVWGDITNLITGAADAVVEKLSGFAGSVKTLISNAFNGAKDTVSSAWNTIKTTVASAAGTVVSAVSSKLSGVKTAASDAFNGAKSVISSAWGGIKSTAISAASAVLSAVKSKFKSVKEAITKPIETARDIVKTAIEKIESIFSGANFKFPSIKLPHFKVSGKLSLSPPSVPHVSVSWYKQGGIFDSPSVIGVGEAGTEAVLPIEKLSGIMRDAMPKNTGNTFYITMNVDGSKDPSVWAAEFTRSLKRQARMGG